MVILVAASQSVSLLQFARKMQAVRISTVEKYPPPGRPEFKVRKQYSNIRAEMRRLCLSGR